MAQNVRMYEIKIYENPDPNGMKLAELLKSLVKYLERKKVKGPVHRGGSVSYVLKNGLDVTYSEGVSFGGPMELEVLVLGEDKKIKKSVGKLKRIYGGPTEGHYIGEHRFMLSGTP